MLKVELLRALKGRVFWLACGVGLISCYMGVRIIFDGPMYFPKSPFEVNPYTTWLFTEAGPTSILGLLAPLLATLPFADSYTVDKNTGYLKFIMVRAKAGRYFRAKFIANALAGGLALLLPLVFSFIVLWLWLPHGLPPKPGANWVFGLMSQVFPTAPALYIGFLIFLAFLFGSTYATFGLALSIVANNNRYMVLATPFLFYNVGNFIIAILGPAQWTPPTTLAPHLAAASNWYTVFLPMAGIFLLSVGLWFKGSKTEVIV